MTSLLRIHTSSFFHFFHSQPAFSIFIILRVPCPPVESPMLLLHSVFKSQNDVFFHFTHPSLMYLSNLYFHPMNVQFRCHRGWGGLGGLGSWVMARAISGEVGGRTEEGRGMSSRREAVIHTCTISGWWELCLPQVSAGADARPDITQVCNLTGQTL